MKKIIITLTIILLTGILTASGYYIWNQRTNTPNPTTTTNSEATSLSLQPMQCEEEPWQTWYKEGHIQFFKAPTDEELIKAYYGSKSMEVISAERFLSEKMVCEACGVCPKSYSFKIKVASKDAQKFENEGWKQ